MLTGLPLKLNPVSQLGKSFEQDVAAIGMF
jgi:hypothetical protein